jgi:serine phosphatase RsbU (regulator of sigma subunit)
MVIDGAGHGVPGAFVTMLVKAIETQIIARIKDGSLESSPSKILEYFNVSIKTMLKQEKGSRSNAGFDGGILYYNKSTKECKYAGAKTDLYIIDDNKLNIISGDKKNVGFVRTKIDQKYTEHIVILKENTKLYLSTDGVFDQEGKNKTRYGLDKFEKLLVDINNQPFEKQSALIMNSFNDFKKDINQTDDVTVVGLNFK